MVPTDCASHAARLVIEIDGGQHATDAAIAYDSRRDAFLHSRGYTVLHFTTADVLSHLDDAVRTILAVCEPRVPHPPAAPVPPPREGEGGC